MPAAWLPVGWAPARAILQVLGCFAGGMLLASRAAIWQRTGESWAAAYPTTGTDAGTVHNVLIGWRIRPRAARILIVFAIGGIAGFACGPKEWVALRAAAIVLGSFPAGALAARAAAIWQRTEHQRNVGRE